MTAPPVAPSVERLHRQVAELEQERKHLLAVIEILQDIAGTLHFADVVQSVTRHLGETFGLDRCSIFLVERVDRTVRLVASYENPGIHNYVVALDRYPELRRALETGETVFIADAAADPSLGPARDVLAARQVKSITAIPITWQRVPIGAIVLRTFRHGPSFSDADLEFCRVVASLTGKALRNAHRFERLQERRGEGSGLRQRERELAGLVSLLRSLLAAYPDTADDARPSPEIERLVEVIRMVLYQEAAAR
jgi:two-component system cell cycle response regulator